MVTCNLASTAIILYPLNEIQISQIQSNCEHFSDNQIHTNLSNIFQTIELSPLIYI